MMTSSKIRGTFYYAHPATKIILVIFLMLSFYLIFFGVSILIAIPAFDLGAKDILRILEENELKSNIGLVKYLQMFFSFGLFLVPALVAGYLINRDGLTWLHMRKPPDSITALIVVAMMVSMVPFINFFTSLNENIIFPEGLAGLEGKLRGLEKESMKLMDAFLDTTVLSGYLLNMFMIAMLPALGEELLFRGIIQRIFSEWSGSRHAGIWIAAFLFSLMHFQFYGFIPRLFLGAIFGYLLVWSGSIWIPVLAHFLNNSMAVTFYYFYRQDRIRYNLDTVGTDKETFLYTFISAGMLALLLFMVWKWEREKLS